MSDISPPFLPESPRIHGQLITMRMLAFQQIIAEYMNLNPTDHKCMLFLMEGRKTAGELAELSGLTTGTLTAVIDRLEKRALVQRVADHADRRKVYVEIVTQNAAFINRAYTPFVTAAANIDKHFSPEEIAIINDYMTRAANTLHDETLKLKAAIKDRQQLK